MRTCLYLLCLCLLSLSVDASAGQDAGAITQAIDEFAQLQIKGLPGNASYSIGTINHSDRLAACDNLQVALPQGGKLWGNTNVVVRCADTPGWSLYVPLKVRVIGPYLVTSRSLRQGQSIAAEDIATQTGDLAELPSGTLSDREQVIGRTLAMSLGAGHPFRSDLLKQALIIQQGQTVKVISKGMGFEVANDGQALNNAAQGQVVRVRMGNGQLVNGLADSAGTVVVAY